MLLRLCQLKSRIILVVLLVIVSCTTRKSPSPLPPEISTAFPAKWFAINKNHSLSDMNGAPLSHLFFDTTAEFNFSDGTVNAVVTTPAFSENAYEVDLNSGQKIFSHAYCKQKDIWDEFHSAIDRPFFSIGILPRTLDQLGDPQKVIIWSQTPVTLVDYQRVRIIGAYVEQVCLEGNCLKKNKWLSRLVFISLNEDDPNLRNIHSLEEFKELLDWEKSKAFLGNLDGRNFIDGRTYPRVKIGELIPYPDAIDYFKKRSKIFTVEELSKIQKECHALYDRFWEKVGKVRKEDRLPKNAEEAEAKTILREVYKQKQLPFGFAARLSTFTKKYFNEITTCEKFVYHGNIKGDREKFWFLSYMGIYYRLHREGYYFDCKSKVWQRNTLNEKALPMHDLKQEIDQCKEAEINTAMNYLPSFLNTLKGEKEFFRFVEKDNHKKIYSWVKMKNLKFDCSNDPNLEIRANMKVFPQEISWKER